MKTLLAVFAIAAVSVPTQAGASWRSEPDSDWSLEVPEPAPPGTPEKPPVNDGGFSKPDEQIFRDRLGKGIFDRICRRASLQLHGDFSVADIGGVGGEFGRRLRQLYNKHEAILDTMRVRFSVGHTFSAPVSETVSLGFWVGASADAESIVMRPLAGKRSCEELDELIDVRKVKTVFPFTAGRITKMQVGELWSLPIRLSWGYSPSLSASIDQLPVSITVGGYTQGGEAALTLYRLGPDQLRMRFRIEDAEFRGHGGALLGTIPAVQVASLGANILQQAVDNVISRELARYVDIQLSYFKRDGHGQRITFETILNPNDREQMQALAGVIRGDLARLVKLVAQRNGLLPTRTVEENAHEIQEHYGTNLRGRDVSTFLDSFRTEADGWNLRLPFITRQNWHSSVGEDRLSRLGSDEGEVRIYHAVSGRESAMLDVPLIGSLTSNNLSRSGQIVTQIIPEGSAAPVIVYIRQRGFERMSSGVVRDMAEEFSKLTALIGRESGAPVPARTALPLNAMFPDMPAQQIESSPHGAPSHESLYDKGAMSLSILLSSEGLRRAIAAEPAAVVRALGNLLDESDRAVLSAMQAAGLDSRSVWEQARSAAAATGNTVDPYYYVHLAESATRLIADLAALRAAPSNDRQAKALAKVLDGQNRSKLSYDAFMSVLVQLAPPSEVRADFSAQVEKGIKVAPNLNSRYRLNGGIDQDPLIAKAGKLRSRFVGRGETTD